MESLPAGKRDGVVGRAPERRRSTISAVNAIEPLVDEAERSYAEALQAKDRRLGLEAASA